MSRARHIGFALACSALGLLFGAALACGDPPDCTTRCGVNLRGAASCESLQAAEDRYVAAFAHRYANVCEQLQGRTIDLHPADDAGSFVDPFGRDVGGYTDCYYSAARSWSKVGWTGDFATTAFAHELTHGIEDCASPGAGHALWVDAGIYDDITTANGGSP